jgi:beta-glucosidase
VFQAPESELTEMGWEVYPEGLYRLLNYLHFGYKIPKLYITENGCSYMDGPDEDGRVDDQRRIDYLQGHLDAVARAIEIGVPVAGYMQWSFMDNFEWARGYEQRFGIVYVEYETQTRYPKDSAFWYRDAIARNGLNG